MSLSSILKHITLKRSVVAISAAAAIGLIVVAVHLKRYDKLDKVCSIVFSLLTIV